MADKSATAGTVGGRYAGDVDARRAWDMLEKDPAAVLVDVRTRAEWEFVGIPALEPLGRQPVLVEWHGYPNTGTNPAFAKELAAKGVTADRTVLFLCRSGGRSASAAAAMTAAGYARCYNIAGGFEGPPGSDRHRGRVDGWKALGLPWIQG
ncbi:MAG: rhodanese-like domain-containing protein [Alphaproteobacteria bacterium]|nr:rhodanese-like domain-containing protein [Alphaproteobacteria bacterium]